MPASLPVLRLAASNQHQHCSLQATGAAAVLLYSLGSLFQWGLQRKRILKHPKNGGPTPTGAGLVPQAGVAKFTLKIFDFEMQPLRLLLLPPKNNSLLRPERNKTKPKHSLHLRCLSYLALQEQTGKEQEARETATWKRRVPSGSVSGCAMGS